MRPVRLEFEKETPATTRTILQVIRRAQDLISISQTLLGAITWESAVCKAVKWKTSQKEFPQQAFFTLLFPFHLHPAILSFSLIQSTAVLSKNRSMHLYGPTRPAGNRHLYWMLEYLLTVGANKPSIRLEWKESSFSLSIQALDVPGKQGRVRKERKWICRFSWAAFNLSPCGLTQGASML